MDTELVKSLYVSDEGETSTAASPRREKTRARLIDAAFEVFAEQGIRASSVETICDAAGFTRGAFYSNFSSKEELLFALLEREKNARIEQLVVGIRQFLEPWANQTRESMTDQEMLDTITRIQELQSDDGRWWLIQSEVLLMGLRDPMIAATFMEDRQKFVAELTDLIVHALSMANREFTIDPSLAVRLVVDFCASDQSDAVLRGDQRSFSERLSKPLSDLVLALTRPI